MDLIDVDLAFMACLDMVVAVAIAVVNIVVDVFLLVALLLLLLRLNMNSERLFLSLLDGGPSRYLLIWDLICWIPCSEDCCCISLTFSFQISLPR